MPAAARTYNMTEKRLTVPVSGKAFFGMLQNSTPQENIGYDRTS